MPLPHSLASFVCPGCPGSRCGLRPYRPSARTLLNAAPTPSLTGAIRFLGRRVSHVSHALLRAIPPLDSVIRMSGAAHLAGVAGFPRPKIPKRLRYSLITSSPMASSRGAWLHDTPNSTLAGRRYLLELFVDPPRLREMVPPDRSFRLSGPLRFPPAPRPQVRHAFDGHPPPAGGTLTHFRCVTGPFRLPGCPCPCRPIPVPWIGSNEAFQPRAPVASQRAELPALRDGELVTVGTRDQQQTRGWQPLAEGLAHPVVWHSSRGRGRGDT
ncbi:hypothetical protein SAMN04487956_1678 [Halomonas saccharevitans]|uniref:Uncharacterized protein n=1 Tax=Halomonas saccharevitans TaxID=416872 RepID=A0A1I7CW55_9GAMM|nr:hypothetical protein SAMN04487956_1678 [Halomonas saccharevitans]